MTEMLRRAALGVVLFFFVGFPSPPSARARQMPVGPGSYVDLGCETCHGTDGAGTAAGPRLATAGGLSLDGFVEAVRRPRGTMPAYGPEDVSDRLLRDLYAWLESQPGRRAPAGRVEAGATLYRKTGCYACHSNEAQGGAQGPRLGPDPVSLAMFIWYTRYPTGSMPPYTTTVLSDRELADIYAFVKSRPEPPPLSSIPLLEPKD